MSKNWEHKILEWVNNHSFKGYDPYDLLSLNRYTRSLMHPFKSLRFDKKIVFLLLSKSNDWFPMISRKLLFIKKKVHPTYLGMLLHSQALLPKHHYNETRVQLIKNELEKHRLNNYKNHCWGTPFAWRSGDTFYPIGTPFAVVCAWIGEAYFELYKRNKNQEDLDVCISICDFFIDDLIITNFTDDSICFSYSPVKQSDINNSNLMVASYLMKVGNAIKKEQYISRAKKATNFSLSTQLTSGLIPYFGNTTCTHNDSYHSSYELKALFDILEHNRLKSWEVAFEKYLSYYLKNYIQPDFSISKYPNKAFPVDGTAMADGLILLYKIQNKYGNYEISKYIEGTEKTINREWIKKDGGIKYKKLNRYCFSSITYTRWVMGWFAIASAYKLRK